MAIPAMQQYENLRTQIIENATLLWSIDDVPDNPAENQIEPKGVERQLTVEREAQLADDLAFISSFRDRSDEVMAVCVEELPEAGKAVFRVASNRRGLQQASRNLKRIANIMTGTATQQELARPDVRESLFTVIVEMDKSRILSRLCSEHAEKSLKTKRRNSLPVRLSTAIDLVQQIAIDGTDKQRMAALRLQCNHMWRLFRTLEGSYHRVNSSAIVELLKSIVHSAQQFDIDGLDQELQKIATFEASKRTSLLEALRKLGHYYRVARNLTSAARSTQCSVFKRFTVEPVECRDIQLNELDNGRVRFEDVVSRITTVGERTQMNPDIRNRLRQKYHNQMFNSTTKWKVHAEIQLLWYYELRPALRRPRIICSSKSACFLCNLFIKVHGQYQIPRSHNRIYDKWTLPGSSTGQSRTLRTIIPVMEEFSQKLESKISELWEQERQRHGPPNESTIGLHSPWSSLSTLRAVARSIPLSSDKVSTNSKRLKLEEVTVESSSEGSETETAEGDDGEISIPRAREDEVLGSHQSSVECNSPSVRNHQLNNHPTRFFLRSDAAHDVIVETDSIMLNLSTLQEAGSQSAGFDGFWTIVESWRDNDALQINNSLCVDVESLQPGSERVLPVGAALDRNSMVMRKGCDLVAVTFRLENESS